MAGNPKALFAMHVDRVKFASGTVSYRQIHGLSSAPNDPFDNEKIIRNAIESTLRDQGLEAGDLATVSDVDEIASRDTIQLLKACKGYGLYTHPEMASYKYSFEFRDPESQLRVMVIEVPDDLQFEYDHKRRSPNLLAASGWHCSWCLRTIHDIQFKMQAYSHSDRVTKHTINPEHIQRAICEGTSIEDMLPEAYTFRDLAAEWGLLQRNHDFSNLPRALSTYSTKWPYLMSGNCQREL